MTLSDPVLARLHWLFLAISLPALLTFALLTPPFQQPDEATHLFKAAHLSTGHILGTKTDRHVHSGGDVDASYRELHNQLGKKAVPLREIGNHPAIAVSGNFVFVGFPNTVQYGPFLYIPQAATLWLSRQLHLTVLQSFYVTRIVTGLVAILIGFAALRVAVRARLMLFFLLTMPMSLFLLGSISQDSLLISGSALFVAIASRIVASEQPPTARQAIFLTGLLIAISLARPTYIVLGSLFLTKPFASVTLTHEHPSRHAGFFLLAIVICAVAAWLAAISNLQVNLMPGVDARQQLEFLLTHPLHIVTLIWNTVQRYGLSSVASFFGILGLYHIVLPMPYYVSAAVGFALSALHGADQTAGLRTQDRWLIFAAIAGGVALTLLALYLTWTPVGADIIEGTQGRYFIPLAMMLPLCLPVFRPAGRTAQAGARWAPPAVVAICAIGAIVATIVIALFFWA